MKLVTTATELPRLMKCIGSRLMPAALPIEKRTEAMDEGNAADWLAETWFAGLAADVGNKAPNGWVITEDMAEHVKTYLSALDCGEVQVETTFGTEQWEVRGRADHISYRDRILVIDDLKYGWRIVEPDYNFTLIAHAIGWCIKNNTIPNVIVFRIIQPRAYHEKGPVRDWSCDYPTLMNFYSEINKRLSTPSSELSTGFEHCAKCHALATCPPARKAAMNAIDVMQDSAFSDDIPNDLLAHEYEVLQRAQSMMELVCNARAELITHRIQSGKVVKGYTIKERRGQRAWMTGMSGKALSAAAGVDLTKDSAVTPAEAERRGVSKEVVNSLTSRALIGVKLEKINVDVIGNKAFGNG